MAERTWNTRIVLQYDGSRYQGWQRQKHGEMTIQAKLEAVLSRLSGEPINVIGASRTDAGVHAEAQVANFHTSREVTPAEVAEYCYRYLPEDIVVKRADEVPERFHSRYLARAKRYVYRICNRPIHDVWSRRYSYHVPEKLDLNAMRRAGSALVGRHDFASFCSSRSGSKSTERELERADVTGAHGLVELTFEAPTFLHGMVRIIAGTLIEVGLRRVDPDDIEGMLARTERQAAGFTAPGYGLCLMEVRYDPPFAL
jgi:tRNA pseudouridine38-40 synthase